MPTPEALWEAWRAGDLRAFEALYDAVAPGLHRLCKALSPAGAEDLLQETFRRAIASAAGYRGESSLQAWLAAIARNAFLDQARRGSPSENPPDREDPASGRAQHEADLLDALATLPVEERESIILHFLQGLTLPETAGVLGISLATAKRRIAEGFERLSKKA